MSANNWKINDSLFYPFGLFNNSSRSKIVFVTWGSDCLYTFTFKRTEKSTTLTEVNHIPLNGTVKDITVTKYNTLALLTNGEIHYFSSSRRLNRLQSLSGVRCISTTENGFALIRVAEDYKISLETFSDFTNESHFGQDSQVFDLNFNYEGNLSSKAWSEENFCLLTARVTEENCVFLGFLLEKNVDDGDVHIFSMSNNLYCLHESACTGMVSEKVLINSVSSTIETIKLLQPSTLLVFMSCGALEIIYNCFLTQGLGRQLHIIGPDLQALAFSSNCFFYSDGQSVVKVALHFSNDEYVYQVREERNNYSNIVALTWVKSIQRLVCLSENNIFYRIKFKISGDLEDSLPDEDIDRILQPVIKISEDPENIRNEIDGEIAKQELIRVGNRKKIYSELAFATLSYHTQIPELSGPAIFPDEESYSAKYFVFLLVALKLKWHEIFKTAAWNLIINVGSQPNVLKRLKLNSFEAEHLNILIPLKKGRTAVPPITSIELGTFLNVEDDFIYISLPVTLAPLETKHLFTSPTPLYNSKKPLQIDKHLWNMARMNNPLEQINFNTIVFTTKMLMPVILTPAELCRIFGIEKQECGDTFEQVLYFLGERLVLKYFEMENYLIIESDDPTALFYAKLTILRGLLHEYYDDEPIELQEAHKALLKIKCELERRLVAGILVTEDCKDTLLRLHKQLRMEIIKHF